MIKEFQLEMIKTKTKMNSKIKEIYILKLTSLKHKKHLEIIKLKRAKNQSPKQYGDRQKDDGEDTWWW